MIYLLAVALSAAAGVLLFVWGLFPPKPSLQSILSQASSTRFELHNEADSGSVRGRFAVWTLKRVQGESLPELRTHMEVTELGLQSFAIDKINAAIGSGVIVAVIAFLRGWVSGVAGIFLCFVIGAVAGYLLPDIELKRKAVRRRDEFERALSAFVTLVAVSVTGGSGINSAMKDASAMGTSWCFRMLDESLEESALVGESPWIGFERLGRRIDSRPLLELAGALALAGTSGARVAETLSARADSARDKELADALVESEKQSERMNTPIGIMLFGWMVILGYPAIGALIGS